jgi:uncharacterized protein YrrD
MAVQLDLGCQVRTSDGEDVGKVDRIIFDPQSLTVREFVVHEGILFTHDRIVAREMIDHIDDDHVVHLRLTGAEEEKLPPFVAEEHVALYTGDAFYVDTPRIVTTSPGSVPRDAVVLSHKSDVYDADDRHIGHLDEIIYGPDGVATAFIIDTGLLVVHDFQVPISAVRAVTHDRIDLSITQAEADPAARS